MSRLLAWGIIWSGMLVLPSTGQSQLIPQKIWKDPVANLEKVKDIEVPEEILNEVEAKPGECPDAGQERAGLFKAQEFKSKGVNLIAVKGGGRCDCSPTGNCSIWVYRDLGGGYVRILSSSVVQQIGFLNLKSHGLPDVVLWSHGSAMESTVRLWQFNGARYKKRCKWQVVFKADSEEAQIENNTCEVKGTPKGTAAKKQ